MSKVAVFFLMALFFLTACKENPKEQEDQIKDLRSRLPSMIGLLSIADIKKNADPKVFDISLLINPHVLTKKTNPSYMNTYINMLPSELIMVFCENKEVNHRLRKYISQEKYLNLNIFDDDNEQISSYKITPKFCEEHGLKDYNIAENINKQLKQGFYDEEFLKSYYVPMMSKVLPNEFEKGFTVTHVVPGPGSRINIFITYKPNENEDLDTATYKLEDKIQSIYAKACSNKDSRDNIAMFQEFTWHGIINDEEVTSLTASQDCK